MLGTCHLARSWVWAELVVVEVGTPVVVVVALDFGCGTPVKVDCPRTLVVVVEVLSILDYFN